MSRRSPTIREIATEADLDVETVMIRLIDAGFQLNSPEDTIWRRDVRRARSALGLKSLRDKNDPSLVQDLASRAGLPESVVRNRLLDARILTKRRLKRVPHYLLVKAEQTLGLRQPSLTASSVTGVPESGQGLTEIQQPPDKTKKLRKLKENWPTIGPVQELALLTAGDVRDIHLVLVEDFRKSKEPIFPPGVSIQALLESAVSRPKTALGRTDKYPTVAMAAAALLHSIVLDHAFHNGNKRTALVAMLAFLDRNGWVLACDQDEIYDLLLRIADHRLVDSNEEGLRGADSEVLRVARWVQACIRKVRVGEYPLQFRQLRAILENYDCVLEYPKGVGNRINIRRSNLQTQVFYRKEGADVDRNTIHKIRKELKLDDAHGYDSDIFYNRGPRIPEFINKYRKLLDRLAKV